MATKTKIVIGMVLFLLAGIWVSFFLLPGSSPAHLGETRGAGSSRASWPTALRFAPKEPDLHKTVGTSTQPKQGLSSLSPETIQLGDHAWNVAHLMSRSQIALYKTYSTAQLMELARQHDPYAEQELAWRQYLFVESPIGKPSSKIVREARKRVLSWAMDSAAFGGVRGIMILGLLSGAAANKNVFSNPKSNLRYDGLDYGTRDALAQEYAWEVVNLMRGNPYEILQPPQVLSNVVKKACRDARRDWKALNRRRKAFGLPPFRSSMNQFPQFTMAFDPAKFAHAMCFHPVTPLPSACQEHVTEYSYHGKTGSIPVYQCSY
jgi:hypothetical protein